MSAMVACGTPATERFYGITEDDRSVAREAARAEPSGPAATARARDAIVANHPEWSDDTQAAARAGEAMVGMTRAQAHTAWWGAKCSLRLIRPVKWRNRVRRESWWYDCAPLLAAHYFVDDTLIAVRLYDEAGGSIPLSVGPSGLGYAAPERLHPLRDPLALFERARVIYPTWSKPMCVPPNPADIP